jgi:hypothetical protein
VALVRATLFVLLLVVALLAPYLAAHAWGAQGHRVTGHIANAHLTDHTRMQLRELLGTDDLSRIATWMDDERDALAKRIPDSPRWHYENRHVCGRGDRRTECPRGACITQQIEREMDLLRNASAGREQRKQAVQVLAHLLGDLHQPLHLADNGDRGGNDTLVRGPGVRGQIKLHELWDTHVLKLNMQQRGALTHSQWIARQFADDLDAWRNGSVELWAEESYSLGKEIAYGALSNFTCGAETRGSRSPVALTTTALTPTVLTDAYLADARAAVDRQLVKAGVRLAHVLNILLDPAADFSR